MLDAKARLLRTHRDAAKAPILRGIAAVVAEQVVERGVALYLREGLEKVVGVHERARPPVSDASVCNVSCEANKRSNCWVTPRPENALTPRALGRDASPPGTIACRPRVSTG